MQTRAKNNIHKPIQKLNLHTQLSKPLDLEPTTPTQALKDPKWRKAMSKNMMLLFGMGHGMFKAHLVAKGFHERPGIDYYDTFSPVVKPTTIRLVLSVAVSNGWILCQLDVNNAFLQGTLTEHVYMTQPPGFIDQDSPSHVCKLKKAIYGLKQAPRAWYQELRSFLLQSGFTNSHADTSLFVLKFGGHLVYFLVYVDDLIITGDDEHLVNRYIHLLANRFFLKDLGKLSYFLRVEIVPNSQGFLLSQCRYLLDLLARTHMSEAKPVQTPLPSGTKISLHSGDKLSDPTEFRVVVGSLQYLLLTRLDIAFALYCDSPLSLHAFSDALHAYSDADWAGDPDDFSSTGAYIVYLGRNPISWSSKKQKTIALIYYDNVGATEVCSNPVFHSRMKHVAIDFHFIRDQVQKGILRVAHVSSTDQLADLLTKSLPRARKVRDRYYTVGTAINATVLLSHGNMNSTHSSLVLGTMGVSQYGNNDIQKCIPVNPSNNLSYNHPASLLNEMIPIMVANREPNHKFASSGLPSFDLDIDEVLTSVAVNGIPNSGLQSLLDGIQGTELTKSS
ncbi:Retrovirus-related Pol polyprotein from transposon RE2 [Vitis vinifera]|uniref:Retrovirus-related Pol polyprotein from transposon RE2 n=1 Tax=Vitis vinifera TaxID=29760 RepID=A0A438HQ49_VITVI|nr:Retrovirus-related Pol polyprotein from transposon RE2 [Vitis vinifera]